MNNTTDAAPQGAVSGPTLTAERLRQLLSYDPMSGEFRWVSARGNAKAGALAGTPGGKGYLIIRIDSRLHYAHRLAFLFMTGSMPIVQVDHINGDRRSNQFANLRLAEGFHNQQNRQGAQRNSSTGFLGVTKSSSKWAAQITANGKRINLGRFKTPEEAYGAYILAKRELHPGGLL